MLEEINFAIIFTTAYDQFAAKAFRLSAIDYLLKPIDTNDIWIAAIARVHNLVVVTNDDHFQYVEGLQVENWSKTSAPSQSE